MRRFRTVGSLSASYPHLIFRNYVRLIHVRACCNRLHAHLVLSVSLSLGQRFADSVVYFGTFETPVVIVSVLQCRRSFSFSLNRSVSECALWFCVLGCA